MKVRDAVIGLKAAEDAGILGTIGRGNINNLKAHLECPSTLVPSQLDPYFITGDYIMPTVGHLFHQIWNIDQGSSSYLLSPQISVKLKKGQSLL
eukprot:Em0023g410a